MPGDGLELFHPLIADWFRRRIGLPTDVQAAAWPAIAAGEHVLVTAPTGSGKTLTAFLWSLNQLASGAWERGQVRVLYVSPLKALNNDIRRNLMQPLWELNDAFGDAGELFPEINVLTRSGDTAPAERQRMVRRPPEILITTPESLNLILSSSRSREILRGLETVILDEIHAVADTKRGTHLITAVERLVPLAGEFQRLALSATVKPLELVAEFVGGYLVEGDPDQPRYRPRPVRLVRSERPKRYECQVHSPGVTAIGPPVDTWWPALIEELKEVVRRNRSTLIFTNGRRMCEKIALLLNEGESPPLAYAHHGSLSRETRAVVEARLKAGELSAIVATGTLELGIDVGSLDEVALVETPFDVAAAIQRIGRAGHQVGETSRGLLFPLHGRDFLQAAVMCRCVANQDIEPIRPIAGALDVLAQVIVAMVGVESWDIDHLYEFLRSCWPYRELTRRQYDLVLAMLAGRYAESRIPALQSRVVLDPLDNLVRAREGARQLVQQSGGTIPDRGYYALRHEQSRARIGELDEEFVWERRSGDRFTLGTQTWRIEQITDSDVLVSPAPSGAGAPFWRGEPSHRTNHFSNRVAELLESLNDELGPPAVERLQQEFGLSAPAAGQLESFLSRQRAVTGCDLPHRHHLLIETIDPHELGTDASWVVLHTFWGGSLNRPFALALQAAWEERHGTPVQAFADNDTIVLSLPYQVRGEELLALVAPEEIDPLLRRQLESSGFFGARFRENAGRALLVTRGLPDRRMPLWLTRLRAKKLLEAVSRYEDFPILAETWRTCLDDEFELEVLRERLAELRAGDIRWSEAHGREPSPLAESIVWGHTNELMYLDDTPAGGRSALSDDLLREAVFSSHLRPELPAELVAEFTAKLQRTYPGYAPRNGDELLDLARERLVIPEDEWAALWAAIARDADPAALLAEVDRKLARVRLPGAAGSAVVAIENLPRLATALAVSPERIGTEALDPARPPDLAAAWRLRFELFDERDPLTELVAGWLQFQGPVPPERLGEVLGIAPERLEAVLAELVETQRVVVDQLTRGGPAAEICDAEHLERLLRLARRAAAPEFTALPATALPLYVARQQGLLDREAGTEAVQRALDPLLGLPLPAATWEQEVLPARVLGYQTAWLDSLMQETGLLWLGCGPKQVAFVLPDLLGLVRDRPAEEATEPFLPPGRHSLAELLAADREPGTLRARLWEAAWSGEVTSAGFTALRKGLDSGFDREAEPAVTRGGFRRWRTVQAVGSWTNLPAAEPPADAIAELEDQKERVRLLLDRYGVLFRELLARELPALQWGRLFRALRLMELSGELLAGYFFEGVGGLQFTSPAGLVALRKRLPEEAVFWLNATDPASLCGARVAGLEELPERRASTVLVYLGPRLVVIARRSGKDLEIRLEPDHPRLEACLAFLGERQRRAFQPVGNLTIETINGAPADRSDYLPALRHAYHLTVGYRDVKLWRQPR